MTEEYVMRITYKTLMYKVDEGEAEIVKWCPDSESKWDGKGRWYELGADVKFWRQDRTSYQRRVEVTRIPA